MADHDVSVHIDADAIADKVIAHIERQGADVKRQVDDRMAELARLRERCRELEWQNACLRAGHRPICSQCGQPWTATACGPTHAVIASTRREAIDG